MTAVLDVLEELGWSDSLGQADWVLFHLKRAVPIS